MNLLTLQSAYRGKKCDISDINWLSWVPLLQLFALERLVWLWQPRFFIQNASNYLYRINITCDGSSFGAVFLSLLTLLWLSTEYHRSQSHYVRTEVDSKTPPLCSFVKTLKEKRAFASVSSVRSSIFDGRYQNAFSSGDLSLIQRYQTLLFCTGCVFLLS